MSCEALIREGEALGLDEATDDSNFRNAELVVSQPTLATDPTPNWCEGVRIAAFSIARRAAQTRNSRIFPSRSSLEWLSAAGARVL